MTTPIRERDRRPPRARWAPGLYGCACGKCGEDFTGDKGSTMCAPCAYAEPEAPRRRPASSAGCVPCPKIDTYQSANAANPASRWIAIFRDGPKKHLPMNFWSASEDGAIARATAFWAEGQERIARQKELAAERSERARRKPASVANEPERVA